MPTLNNYSFQTLEFGPDYLDEEVLGGYSWLNKPLVLIDQKFLLIDASTPQVAALKALVLAVEPRREGLSELGAPKVVIEAFSRRNLFKEMEEGSEGIWVYKIAGLFSMYYEARCLDLVDADMNPGREES